LLLTQSIGDDTIGIIPRWRCRSRRRRSLGRRSTVARTLAHLSSKAAARTQRYTTAVQPSPSGEAWSGPRCLRRRDTWTTAQHSQV